MKILFKSNVSVFYIVNDELYSDYIGPIDNHILDEVPHINEFPIIYHIIENDNKYPAYYEYKNNAIIKSILNDNIFGIITFEEKDKDYTQVNINKLLNGNII